MLNSVMIYTIKSILKTKSRYHCFLKYLCKYGICVIVNSSESHARLEHFQVLQHHQQIPYWWVCDDETYRTTGWSM